jgi:hypothetical protein
MEMYVPYASFAVVITVALGDDTKQFIEFAKRKNG